MNTKFILIVHLIHQISPASDFKLAKSIFLAKYDVSTSITFFKSAFVAYLENLIQVLHLLLKILLLEKVYLFVLCLFYLPSYETNYCILSI